VAFELSEFALFAFVMNEIAFVHSRTTALVCTNGGFKATHSLVALEMLQLYDILTTSVDVDATSGQFIEIIFHHSLWFDQSLYGQLVCTRRASSEILEMFRNAATTKTMLISRA
jgi:hypothetical protein